MKKYTNLLLTCILVLCLFEGAKAQQSVIQFRNGLTIIIKTEISPQTSAIALGQIYSSNSGNTLHRVLLDRTNKIYIGYDLIIEKQANTRKLKISFKPLSKKPSALIKNSKMSVSSKSGRVNSSIIDQNKSSTGNNENTKPIIIGSLDYKDYTAKLLPNYPKDIILEHEDTLTIDLLQNSKTKAKISDSIKFLFRSGQSNYYFNEGEPAKNYTIEDVILRLERPEIHLGNRRYKTDSTVAGSINWIYIKGKGRFIFSFKPQSNYSFHRIGIIQNNVLSFEFNGDKYKFISKSPILGLGGKWNLWVMHDPNYQPDYELPEDSPFILGTARKVTDLFEE